MTDRPDRPDRKRQRRVTLADVARHAAVSRALVSIVMRDAPGASAATRERVRASATALGYRPDLRARALAGQTSRLIGIMFGGTFGVYHFDLLDGLYAAAEVHGHTLILSPLTPGRDEELAAQSLYDFQFDGLIMLSPQTAAPLLAGTVPVVVVGWHVDHPDVDIVRTSDEAGLAKAVDHLVDLGHRRIVHVDGGDTLIGVSRRNAYAKAMTAHGLADQVRVVPGGQSHLDGQRAARLLLDDATELPSAIVAYNDDVAVAAIDAISQHGLGVPADISVTGFDDSDAATLSAVELTSVAQEPGQMARAAVDRIVARIEGQPVDDREIVFEPVLRVRQSTRRHVEN